MTGPSKTKISEFSRKHKKRIHDQFVTDCQSTLSFSDIYDFVATKVEIYNYDSQSYDVIDLTEC